MSDGEGSEPSNSPQPQELIPFLFSTADFAEHVQKDECNLCCVVVTSTLCNYSGVQKIKYPKVKAPAQDDEDENGDGNEEEDEPEEEEEEDTGKQQQSNFFSQMKAKLVENKETLFQRRHVRFFHVCGCAKEETNIAPLVAADPALAVTGRQPNAQEKVALHEKAHGLLLDLLHTLNVKSTPTLLFFLKGQPLRYSLCENTANPAIKTALQKVAAAPASDVLQATGANVVKWRRMLNNAVVLRNDIMAEYDAAMKQKLKEEKKEARRLARLARQKHEGEEEEEEEEDN